MKFTKENLAAEICKAITFEYDIICFIGSEIDFNGVIVYVGGKAFSKEKLSGGVEFHYCEIDEIEVYHEDPSEDFVFNNDELIEMEELVKLWM